MAPRLKHVTRSDIRTEFSTGITVAAATLVRFDLLDLPAEDRAREMKLAAIAACDLFDVVSEELAIRVNLEIDEANRQIEETVGSVSKGGDA